MNATPKWYVPVTVLALAWNLVGCFAYLQDAMLTPEDLAQMDATARALYEARPSWSVAATAVAVWAGAIGCLGLLLRRRWATPLLLASLAGVIVQDLSLFLLGGVAAEIPPAAYILQGLVLLIAIGLVLLARKATAAGWIA